MGTLNTQLLSEQGHLACPLELLKMSASGSLGACEEH